jgi:hypothetical protein
MYAHVFKYNHNHDPKGMFAANADEYVGGMAKAMQQDAESVKAVQAARARRQEKETSDRSMTDRIRALGLAHSGQGKRSR